MPVLQGLAGGTLLYVTVSEVLPRERARWHRNVRRCAGIVQTCSVLFGFTVIFCLNRYLGIKTYTKFNKKLRRRFFFIHTINLKNNFFYRCPSRNAENMIASS